MPLVVEAGNRKGTYLVRCPGCKQIHALATGHTNRDANWDFNGNFDKPSFTPSFRIGVKGDANVCHSYIKKGQWESLPDSTHDLSGKTVPMLEIEVFEPNSTD